MTMALLSKYLSKLLEGARSLKQRKNSNKILTCHLYPTTFLITVQGNHHKYWSDHEFEYMKSIVDAACCTKSDESKVTVHELNDTN